MNPNNPLNSVVFITLPEDFEISKKAMHIDTTIPLPVQLPLGSNPEEPFDISTLSEEMILAGILTVLAYDKSNPNLNYYRNIITNAKPNIKTELSEAAILKARNEDFEIAEEIFDALRGLDQEDMAIVLNTALFFDQRADSYRKSGLIEDADAYDNDAEYYYKQAMDSEPAIPDAFFNAGFFYLKQKNFIKGNATFNSIYRLWKLYHLNDLHAGTKKQEEALKQKFGGVNANIYTEQCEYLKSINLYDDNGYKFGTGWIKEEIPANDLQEIKRLLTI